MRLVWRIAHLTPWLARHGAEVGDFLIDRLAEPHRYMILRPIPIPLPPAGESTGHVLGALADDALIEVNQPLDPPGNHPPGQRRPRLVVHRGDHPLHPVSPPPPPRSQAPARQRAARRWRLRAPE